MTGLAGRLEDLALADIFQILSIRKKTGTFLVKGTKGTALIVFQNGLVVRAETDDLEDTLADFMLKAGMIRETVFQMAVEVKKKLPTQSLADLLLDLGAVSREALERATRKRIEHVIYRLLLWKDGDFQFELDDLDIGEKTELKDLGWELSKGLSPEYLLMEGARVQDESAESSFDPTQAFTVDDHAQKEEAGAGTGWDDNWSENPALERKDLTALRSLTQELIPMDFEVTRDTRNELLARREVDFRLRFDGPTPSRMQVISKLAAGLNVNEKLLVLDSMKTSFGKTELSGMAMVYDSEVQKAKTGRAYLSGRGMPKPKEGGA